MGTSANQGQSTAVEWQPSPGDPTQRVHFWIVVRDGRGGEAWVERLARYTAP